jgi:hypothetical protein
VGGGIQERKKRAMRFEPNIDVFLKMNGCAVEKCPRRRRENEEERKGGKE